MSREQWWRDNVVTPVEQPKLNEGILDFLNWLIQTISYYKAKFHEVLYQYRDDEEGAIIKAAEYAGIDKRELERRAHSIMESRIEEGWFTDFLGWWKQRAVNLWRGLGAWIDDRSALACALIMVCSLHIVTVSSMPFVSKLVVWLYAYYLIDKAGRE